MERARRKKWYRVFLLAVCLLLAMPAATSAAGASIKLNASKKSLTVGSSVKLKASVTGKKKTVTWKSSKPSVASVSKNGVVKAKKAGKTTITAKANGKTAKCVITVKKASWAEAYRTLLSASKLKWSDNGLYIPTSGCKFAVVYVNNDSIPELLVIAGSGSNHVSGFYKLYTYTGGKVKEVGIFRDAFGYYKKKGILVGVSFLYGEYYTYMKMTASGKLAKKLSQITSTSTTYADGSGNTITKAAFESRLKKLVGSASVIVPTGVENTEANRVKYLK